MTAPRKSLVAKLTGEEPPKLVIGKYAGPDPVTTVRAGSGPADRTPEMPDFESIYAGPESQKRQKAEAKQARDRRRSMWRDLNFGGFHGVGAPDAPTLRYREGVTSTADIAISRPVHYLTAEQLRAHQDRVKAGAGLSYDLVQTGRSKRGKV